MSKRIIYGAIAALGLLLPCGVTTMATAAGTNANDTWKFYTSFEAQPRKIIDGERYTYFLVFQTYFAEKAFDVEGSGAYSNPVQGLLYYDKQHPENGIRSLHEMGRLDSGLIRQAAYNPLGKYLIVVYTNGAIDLVRDSGEIVNITSLKNGSTPFAMTAYNISFPLDSNDAWIGTQNGFVQVDCNEGKVLQAMDLGMMISDICRVGNQVVAIAKNKTNTVETLYVADANNLIRSKDDFKAVTLNNTRLEFIMPLADNAFATVYDRNNFGLAKLDSNGSWKITKILTDTSFSSQLYQSTATCDSGIGNFNGALNFREYLATDSENNVSLCADGYLIFSKNNAYLIKKGLSQTGTVNYESRKFEKAYPTWVGSSDFNTFWFYEHRWGFRQAQASGAGNTTTWSWEDVIVPETGGSLQNARLVYSPRYGVIMANQGGDRDLHVKDPIQPFNIHALKNGRWTDFCPSHRQNMPLAIEADESLKSQYLTSLNRLYTYPITEPMGLEIDPVYPDYVYTGSIWFGNIAFNLSNPRGQILNYGSEYYHPFESFPGFKSLGLNRGWWSYSYMRSIGHDANGTMWMFFSDNSNNLHGDGLGFHLYYWTKEDRKAVLEAQDVAAGPGWKKIYVPTEGGWGDFCDKGIALSSQVNVNKLLLGHSGTNLVLVDHKGTLDDCSDDIVQYVSTINLGADGAISDWGYIHCFGENPVTGRVLMGTNKELISIDMSSMNSSDAVKGEIFSIRLPDGSTQPVVPSQKVVGICYDEYNRCWIATSNNGVYGVSADETRIIAHYHMGNSPLPSNNINDVCWNPETKELMIATSFGLCSVRPDMSGASQTPAYGNAAPYLSHRTVAPDFTGCVVAYNVPAQSNLQVVDSRGNVVRTLGMPSDNKVVWDLLSNDETMVKSDFYTITDIAGLMPDLTVSVVR